MSHDRYQRAAEELASLLNLSEDALSVAEGWSILPEGIQRHFKLLIDEYIANLNPALEDLYANARTEDQLRFNRIVERAQDELRHRRPDAPPS